MMEQQTIHTQPNPFSRRLNLINTFQEFCKRNNLSYRQPDNDEDPVMSILISLDNLVLRNEFKRYDDKHKDLYMRMKIWYNKKKVLTGYFTIDEVADIKKTLVMLDIH